MNKKLKLVGALCLVGMLFLSGCQFIGGGEKQKAAEPAKTDIHSQAVQLVSQMNDKQKIGQLMMIGIKGGSLSMDDVNLLADYKFGNVILFDRNMTDTDQVKALNTALRSTIKKNSGVVPFIALDQEGGRVLRMRDHFPAVPSAASLGQQDPSQTKTWAMTTGKAMTDLGFTVDFAPVVDLGSAAERSYSNDPDQVIARAEQAVNGYKESGVWSSLKHFPGIGKVKTDPHIDGDSVSLSRNDLEMSDMKPFRELIKRMDNRDMFIMVSNVTFPALDPANPACISPIIVTDILRKQYGYTGLILTDDMEMGAMSKHYTFRQMGVLAIKAGADIVLVCQEYNHEKEAFDGLLEAYESGDLPQALIDEKVTRIVETKLSRAEVSCIT